MDMLTSKGDRDIEWSWVASQIPRGPGEALDFGCGNSYLSLIATRQMFNVTAVDLLAIEFPYNHPRINFIKGNILELSLPKESFDLVINCSTIEHVGLAGRYSETQSHPKGDIEAMFRLNELMKSGGNMLLTIPMGQDAVFSPKHRIYGEKRLPLLLDGFTVEKKEFWIKNLDNHWVQCDEKSAISFNALESLYALGLFELKKP
jgi:SAM-dependent methyltransferase